MTSNFFVTFVRMKRYIRRTLFIFLQIFFFNSLCAQTVIDLKPGGGVRAKTVEEYRKDEPGLKEKLKADSLQYNDHLTRALNALYRDSIQQAERLLNEALRLRPNAQSNYIVRHYLGRISMARGDYRRAIHQFDIVLRDYPAERNVRFDRASCYLEIKNTKAAMEDCEALLTYELSQEEYLKVLFLRSATYTESRHPDKAKKDLEEILKKDPGNESATLLLAFAYDDIGQPQEALNRLNLFVTAHPQSIDGLIARAELEERLGMDEAARADYDNAIKLNPKNASLYVKRAKLLLRLELNYHARKDIREAIRLGYPAEALLPLLPKED